MHNNKKADTIHLCRRALALLPFLLAAWLATARPGLAQQPLAPAGEDLPSGQFSHQELQERARRLSTLPFTPRSLAADNPLRTLDLIPPKACEARPWFATTLAALLRNAPCGPSMEALPSKLQAINPTVCSSQ